MKIEHHFRGPVLDYVRGWFAAEDEILVEARRRARSAGLPPIEVAPEDGALLATLVAALGARRVVEIGTLFGYSAIWMARAMPPEGRLLTIESNPDHAEVARVNLEAARLTDRVTVLEGPGVEVLAGMRGPFDLVFIDADKAGYPDYLAWAERALRPGGLVLGDNAFLQGRVADAGDESEDVAGMRRFLETLAEDPAWTSTIIPTLEGMALGVRS